MAQISIDDEDRRDMAFAALQGLANLVNWQALDGEINPLTFGPLLNLVVDAVNDAMPTPKRPRRPDND